MTDHRLPITDHRSSGVSDATCGEFSGFGRVPKGARGGPAVFRSVQSVSEGREILADGSRPSGFPFDRRSNCRGLGKTRLRKHFVSKLSDADGEQQETQHWIDTALDCDYLTRQIRDELVDELERIGRMLHAMINKADQFCGASIRCVQEDAERYFVDQFQDLDDR